MIETFLLCLIVMNAYQTDCTTLHPNLSELIPKDLLPEDNLLPSYPITYNLYNNKH